MRGPDYWRGRERELFSLACAFVGVALWFVPGSLFRRSIIGLVMFYLFIRLVGRYPELVARFVTQLREPGLLTTSIALLAVAVILLIKTGRQQGGPPGLLFMAGAAALAPVLISITEFMSRHRALGDIPGRGIWLYWISRLALDVLVAVVLFALLLKTRILPEIHDPRERELATALIASIGASFLLRARLATVGSAGNWTTTAMGLQPLVARLDQAIDDRISVEQHQWLQYLASVELSNVTTEAIAKAVREELSRIPVPPGETDGVDKVARDPSLDDSNKHMRLLALLLDNGGPRLLEDVVARLREEGSGR